MKHAHSIPLGHLVEAGNVPHATTMDRRSLVTCPSCKEPVAAVHRGDQHFFSHHPGTARTQVSECELRVVRMAQEAAATDEERKARRNNLRFFLAIIDRMAMQAVTGFAPLSGEEIRTATKNGLLPIVLRGYQDILRANVAAKGIGSVLTDTEAKRFDNFTRHAFGVPMLNSRHQRGYADEMLETLLTPPCAPQLLRVQTAAYMATLVYLSQTAPEDLHPALHGSEGAMWEVLVDPDRAASPMGALTSEIGPFYHGMNLALSMTAQIVMAMDYGGWLERRSTDATLRHQVKAAMAAAPARAKRKPKPKKTHRKAKPGRARRAA